MVVVLLTVLLLLSIGQSYSYCKSYSHSNHQSYSHSNPQSLQKQLISNKISNVVRYYQSSNTLSLTTLPAVTPPVLIRRTMKKSQRKTSLSMAIKGPVRYSSNDWLECLLNWPSSRILQRVKSSVMFLGLWTAALVTIYKIKSLQFLFPASVHSILGSALGLLLVFRTNTSYDRFWEGRKLWSSLITASRELARKTFIHVNKEHHKEIACYLIAHAICLKQHLQGDKIDAELNPFLEGFVDINYLQNTRNRPGYMVKALSKKLHQVLHEKYTNTVEATLHEHSFEEDIHSLTSVATNCERIVKQPVPSAYSRHASRFVTIYLLTLPLTLIPLLSWYTIPTMVMISWSFLSIQEIGHFIEEPFNKELQLMPLQQLVSVIRSDISGIISCISVMTCVLFFAHLSMDKLTLILILLFRNIGWCYLQSRV